MRMNFFFASTVFIIIFEGDRSIFKPELWNYTSRVQEINHMTRELKNKRVEAKSKVTGELRMIYKATTNGGSRDMMKKEFGTLCKKFFPQIPEEVQEDWFDVFDTNGDGIIDFDGDRFIFAKLKKHFFRNDFENSNME